MSQGMAGGHFVQHAPIIAAIQPSRADRSSLAGPVNSPCVPDNCDSLPLPD